MTTKEAAGIEYLPDESSPEDRGSKQALTQFKPGQSGNPKGRPKGARSRLGEQFIQALADDFEEHRDTVIKQLRTRELGTYIKVIKDVLPREVLIRAFNINASVDLSEIEQSQGRLAAYRYARDMIGAEPLHHIEEGSVVTDAWRHDDDD